MVHSLENWSARNGIAEDGNRLTLVQFIDGDHPDTIGPNRFSELEMPKLYRSMRKGDDQKPLVDATGKGLGVRGEPVNGVIDVDLDLDGTVILNSKGMSVAPNWRDLPYFLISKRLGDQFPGARGAKDIWCFTMGEGSFSEGPVADGLDLKIDTPKHGVVAPRSSVLLDQYQADLASTRDYWTIDEA